MSNIALSWAFRCHVGNASAKAVLVYLADRASDDGTAAQSDDRLRAILRPVQTA